LIEGFSQFGATILAIGIPIACVFGAAWLTDEANKRFFPVAPDEERGCLLQCVIFLSILAILCLLFLRPAHILHSYTCRSAENYADCMDPPPDD
jgi:hypothetical protein